MAINRTGGPATSVKIASVVFNWLKPIKSMNRVSKKKSLTWPSTGVVFVTLPVC